jgi:hypothetical protein
VDRPDGPFARRPDDVGDAHPPAIDRRLDEDVHVDALEHVDAPASVSIRVDVGWSSSTCARQQTRNAMNDSDSPVSGY